MGMMGHTVPGVVGEGAPRAIIPDAGESCLSYEHQPTRISLKAQEGPTPVGFWTKNKLHN